MRESKRKKTCFLITPLGEEASAARARADDLCSAVLEPLLDRRGLALVRGDRIPGQGSIMVQVVRETLDATAVVADLTGLNPNVLYELGIADALRKPVLRLIHDPATLPFDLRGDRTLLLRSGEGGRLLPADVEAVLAPVDQFLGEALHWGYRLSTCVTEAIAQSPVGWGEVGLMRMVGGYTLAEGWEGVEKALQTSGARIERFRAEHPQSAGASYRVELIAALTTEIAELHLSFGDWMEAEVESYLGELARVLVACGSPYRLVAIHGDACYVAEPGDPQLVRLR